MKFILPLLLLTISIALAASPKSDKPAKSRQEMQKIATNLEKRIKQNPKNAELHIQLGFIYSKLKKINKAQKSFETAIRLNPKKSKAHFMLGLIYEKKGLKNKAIAAWQACLDNTSKEKARAIAIKHLRLLRGN